MTRAKASSRPSPGSTSLDAASTKVAGPLWQRPGFWLKPLVFFVSLLPFAALLWSVVTQNAGPNPIETIEKQTGEWSLRFLLLSLAMTPAAELFRSAWPIRLRRMVGLFAFFYVTVHFLAYTVLDQYLNFADILDDVVERPYITAGFAAFLLLVPLAVTSNRFMIRKMRSRWKALHRWVYIAAIAGVLHYVWLVKGEQIEPVVYLFVLTGLLAYRVRKIL